MYVNDESNPPRVPRRNCQAAEGIAQQVELNLGSGTSSSPLEDRHAKPALAEAEATGRTVLLDPARIRCSRWLNRMGFSFDSEAFRTLKAEIADASGNIQPIKVRPLSGHDGEYEIVFGHRRHRACLELGLPVLAVVSDLHDSEMWLQMERENRARADLSPYEQGMHYRRALDAGLFPSNRKLAEAIGVDLGQVGKVLALARLHDDIVAAFKSPADIQVNWSKALTGAAAIDPAGTRARGRSIADARAKGQLGKDDRPRAILDALTGGGLNGSTPSATVRELRGRSGQLAAQIRRRSGGGYTIEVLSTGLTLDQVEALLRPALKL